MIDFVFGDDVFGVGVECWYVEGIVEVIEVLVFFCFLGYE